MPSHKALGTQRGSGAAAHLDFCAGQELGKQASFPSPDACSSMGIGMNEEGEGISYSCSLSARESGCMARVLVELFVAGESDL